MEYQFSAGVNNVKASAIREILKSAGPDTIPFSAGNPSPDAFPVEAIQKITNNILEKDAVTALQYGITEGYTPLREMLKSHLTSNLQSKKEGDDVVITSGAQQGIRLIAETLCDSQDTIICESPSFVGALNSFRSLDANVVGVPVEKDGINIDALEKTIQKSHSPKLLYIISTFQNPTGVTTSLEKRKVIYLLAQKYNLVILEDNPYGDLRYFGDDVPTIKSLDTEGRVVYCGSFSKILSPGIRVGYLCGPQSVLEKAVIIKQGQDVHTNMLLQMVCYQFFNEYNVDAHLTHLRDLYRRKLVLMLDEMDKNFSDKIIYNKPQGGLFIWCSIKDNGNALEFAQKAAAQNVTVVPGNAFATEPNGSMDSFRMNFSTPTDENIVKGIQILGNLSKSL